jgi:carbamoyl-phosphate synthase large subunit
MTRAGEVGVLITSASRKVWLVRAFGEALRRVDGGRVVAVDVDPHAPALYTADHAELVPRSDDPAFVDHILGLCQREGIRLVVPTRDEELPVFARARQRFAAAGVLVLVSGPEAIETCQDKWRFVTACRAAGLGTPRVVERPSVEELPLFVRPVTGKGGRGARSVRTAAQLAAAGEELGEQALWQELVSAPELTVDVFLSLDGTPITCVPRERLLVIAGESHVARTTRDGALRDATLRLCAALGLVGHNTIQAFRRDDEVLFLEVNPRYGGGAALGFAAGAFTPELAVRTALGERLTPRLDAYEVGLVMLRYSDDLFLHVDDLLARPATSATAKGRRGSSP